MSTFPNFQTSAAEDFDMIDSFYQEYDNLDYLFEEEPGATPEDDVQMDYAADAEGGEGAEEEEEDSSDEDCECEIDEDSTAASSGNTTTINNNANTTTNDNDNNNDENEDTVMEDHHPMQQQQQEEEEEGPTRKELEEWQIEKLETLQKTMASTRARIAKLHDKIAGDQAAISNKQAEYDREWEARNMGQHELQQILAAKTKIEEQLAKKQANLQKAVEKIGMLEKEERDVMSHPREAFMKGIKKVGRRRKTRSTAQSQTDLSYRLDEGEDSLSEQDGPAYRTSSRRQRKNAASACRRCKANKVKCDMKRGQCTHCRLLNKRCRYNDPWDSARQLRPYQLQETEAKLEQSQNDVDYYKQLSLTSVLADNPLSGITGYGPRPATGARQNYARLNRGMDPITRPLPVCITASGGQDGACTVLSDPVFPQKPRQVVPVNPSLQAPPAPASQRETRTHWIYQTVPPTIPAKRGRKPGQKSSKRPRLSEDSTQPGLHLSQQREEEEEEEEAEARSITNMQTWWRRQILSSGRHLPVNNDYTTQWPAWIFLSNEKQRLWFDYMVAAQREIPSVAVAEGRANPFPGTRRDVLQPCWPGWTRVMEAPLGEQRAGYLVYKKYATVNADAMHT
ncbi:hypothetical protein UA08_08335 [Talaromyces atroroseus]|uniref:Zn(2)-C6 fungal-type domain-containing protein n=1 Tax=Talaromyces atroroseus TaxID=1441469 RepID=A0A225AH84_TALAT|nr:hypothetical protein UA08_08335 [Talaromyces atroroseus]OKL56388.1 hypothetical protein UA08_08335 [Talaromyces atroroseus]